jgi:chemosensory pili system protein ChpA (sensor histidine kinase/response regulator)
MALPLIEIPEQTTSDEIDEEILEIFIEEAEEVLAEIHDSYAVWKNNPSDKDALTTLRRAFHTLKGSGRLVGAMPIGEFGWVFENMLNRVIDGSISVNSQLFKLIDQVEETVTQLIEQFKNGEAPFYEAVLLMSQARHFTDTKGAELGVFVSAAEAGLASAGAPSAESLTTELAELIEAEPETEVEPEAESEIEALLAAEESPEVLSAEESIVAADASATPEVLEAEEEAEESMDPTLLTIFRKEANGHLVSLKDCILDCRQKLPCAPTEKLFRIMHTLNGSSRSMGMQPLAQLAAAAEKYMRAAIDHQVLLHKAQLALLVETGKMLNRILSDNGKVQDPQVLAQLCATWQSHYQEVIEARPSQEETLAPEKTPSSPPATMSHEAEEESSESVDEEFLEIFLEEADEILETSQSLVGRWLAAPNSMPLLKELQRELHTLKGGSRMVGISAMGDLSHQLESVLTRIVEGNAQSNLRFQELVQQSLDELAGMLENVRGGKKPAPALKLIEEIRVVIDAKDGAPASAPPPETQGKPAEALESAAAEVISEETASATGEGDETEGEERVRVRASLIDKLTNLAGEMSIQRAHMEQQQGAVKSNLNEMEQTVMRLRDLLRRLEIETEVQIMSHIGGQHYATALPMPGEENADFDPLEMDRFSTMQQLSRSLLETVTDLQSIQDNLKTLTRQNEHLLIQQSRVGGDLQDSIMSTRMVPFSQLSPRLQRIARLTSRELKKQVVFSINDDNIEFERTILNRIVAPLEHMLRNAIGHGVETPDQRKAAGKPVSATVRVELSQEGSELLIRMTDDGAGINTEAIRKKAEKKGMLQPGNEISENELIQFILEPAFSTAEKVTQVSGRGVGMDIVNSEVKQLGGALEIFSERGKGSTFQIRIPTTLTIIKGLLIHLGEETMAVPVDNVDAVMRVPREQVAAADGEDSYYQYMGQAYRLIHLAELLGFNLASIDTALLPMLLVSVGDSHLALVVDGIEGSKEVVVKPVGPQLSSIRWIAGATILGDGRVVIILDILTLMRLSLTHHAPQQAISAAAAMAKAIDEAKARVRTVMVVDDSITVRKVTARFLKRQGMEVITAKDGLDAVAQLQDVIPDIVLLDVEMPRMDGFELATQIRNDARLKDLPLIMITSRTGAKHRERASKIGIDRHLGKPFNENELLENIDQLLSERGK